MTVRTNINTSHLVRLGIIGSFCLGMTLYCFYDGLVGYPNQRIRANAFIEFKEEHSQLDPKDIVDQWKEYAAERGWPTNDPGKPRSDYDINSQFVMAGILGPIGLFFLFQLLLNRGRWIELNDSTLTSSMGDELTLDQIVELNKKKWQKKGIAKLKYDAGGRTKKLVLDDCNYERVTTNTILRHIEENIDHAKIVGGKPEPPLKKAEGEAPASH
ncbi:MAG: hypothetical protein KDA57_00855 [Planctomycetales bacterium]|nr:hypothetical protein [Planctomycetales bacterium]